MVMIICQRLWLNTIDLFNTEVGLLEEIIDFKGNDYHLITSIVYTTQRIYIKYVLTHSEYDQDK
jgi:mRNA-degrading endonuclease HigB of HigAB toxin-antitoxin module